MQIFGVCGNAVLWCCHCPQFLPTSSLSLFWLLQAGCLGPTISSSRTEVFSRHDSSESSCAGAEQGVEADMCPPAASDVLPVPGHGWAVHKVSYLLSWLPITLSMLPDQGYMQVKRSLSEGFQLHRCPQISPKAQLLQQAHSWVSFL